jgi:glycerophosphoryl diester phosphodiesterase
MTPWPYPFWIAHRGAGKLAPENTLAAFRLGASHGYRAFECDVKLSREGEPFLLHDADLGRTAGGQGVAGDLSWDALSRLDAGAWHSAGYAGEPIPRLEGIARFCIANGCALNIEIKPTPGHEAETGRVVAQVASRLWQGASVPPLLSSFQPAALVAAQAAVPALPRALLLDKLRAGWADEARALGAVAVAFHRSLPDAQTIAQLHAEGRRALAYTVNDPAEAQRLIDAGIDGLITDAVDRFDPAVERAVAWR